jgi:hypothetical protein
MQANVQRRAVRRAVRTSCQAVEIDAFRLVGERVLDLSPRGMLVRCEGPARVGDSVLVSFQTPGLDGLWLEAEAMVARIVQGYRAGDRGPSAGLTFTYFEKSARNELLARLAGLPPPLPQRRLRTARDRERSERLAPRIQGSVVVHSIVTLWDPPARPRAAPRGTFTGCYPSGSRASSLLA